MDHYLFTARSVTHAQQMASILARAGVPTKIRRVGAQALLRGCGYTLELPARFYARARSELSAAGQNPIRIFSVSSGRMSEVTP